jgi:sporulation and spore germination protein/immunoglobulin-like protein involved in spore germination
MKPLASIAALSALMILSAACATSGSAGTIPPREPTPAPSVAQGSPDVTPAPPSTAPTGSPAASPDEGTTIVRTYFYLGGEPRSAGLVPLLREVPATKAVATAAMNALLAGPTSAESGERTITSAIPAGSSLLGLTVSDGVATVDLSSEFASGGGSASAIIRLGQVVYTLTQFPTVTSVLFEIDGQVVTVFGSEGVVLDGPVGRLDYLDLLPAIFVDRPAYNAALGNPGRITGSAQGVFEATFRVMLLDGAGRTIADEMVMAACMCESGAFDATVRYDVPKAQWGTLRVWADSAKDGSAILVREYPVWLTPAS